MNYFSVSVVRLDSQAIDTIDVLYWLGTLNRIPIVISLCSDTNFDMEKVKYLPPTYLIPGTKLEITGATVE